MLLSLCSALESFIFYFSRLSLFDCCILELYIYYIFVIVTKALPNPAIQIETVSKQKVHLPIRQVNWMMHARHSVMLPDG